MELIPFDLEKALAGESVVTRDGREVTEIHYFKTARECKIIAAISGNLRHFYENGMCLKNSATDYDLFMKPKEPEKIWFNVYKQNDHYHIIGIYKSQLSAEKNIIENELFIKTGYVEV